MITSVEERVCQGDIIIKGVDLNFHGPYFSEVFWYYDNFWCIFCNLKTADLINKLFFILQVDFILQNYLT